MNRLALVLAIACTGRPAAAQDCPPGPPLDEQGGWRQIADPPAAGWSAEGLAAARATAVKARSAAVLAVWRGQVVAAWGAVDRPFELHSARKSLVSLLLGAHRDKFDLDATLADLDINDEPPLSTAEKQATLRDLLCSRSAVYHTAAKEPPDMKASRPERGAHAPGEHFWYNNWGFNALGTIFERQTRRPLFDAFRATLADPLGLQDLTPDHMLAELEPSNSLHPAHAFHMSARDLARFGQLVLQNGCWNGRQLVPAAWLAECMKPWSPVTAGESFGFMWWLYEPGELGLTRPILNECRTMVARGAGGQFCGVAPELDLVMVHLADTEHDARVSDRDIWTIFEQVAAARPRAASPAKPQLQSLSSNPFDHVAPALVRLAAVELPAALRAQVCGHYVAPPKYDVRVFEHAGRLFVNAVNLGETELFLASTGEFLSKAEPLRLRFVRAPDGRMNAMEATLRGEPTTLQRVD